MSADEKYTTLNEEKIPAVYEAGKKAGQDDMWTDIVIGRDNFESQFAYWQMEYIRPPIKITPSVIGGVVEMCRNNPSLKVIESAHFDFSKLPTGTANNKSYYYTFYNCSALELVEDIGIGTGEPVLMFAYTFGNCSNLHTIEKLTVAETTKFSNAFNRCSSLTNLTFEGTIGQNGLNLSWSPLTHDSLMSTITALADKSGDTSTTWSVTLGADNLAKLTAAEITIAEEKGWGLV